MNTFSRAPRSGFTLVEATLSVLIVSILMVAAMAAADVAITTQSRTGDRAAGRWLAAGLMTDVLSLAYQDPNYPTTTLGIDPGESANNKATFDDVDDFNGWSESPPQDKGGNVIPRFTNWKRTVTVQWCSATAPSTISGSETGCKLITVQVFHNNVMMATRVALKANVP
ncbi:MAG: prepilin-type N-terminal cleavage/methylation domain-containing protein [Phycisphaerae bacterium]|nr:prepilin-type N-terminal cleavage/methylation domain-containing protein [Phycisphaerae bacterium]